MNDDSKKLAELYKPKQAKVVNPDRQLCMVRFSLCGKVLAGACQDGTVRRWDATGDTLAELPPLKGHGGWVQAIVFHPDGKRLFAADSWGGLRCWPFEEKEAAPLWEVKDAHDGWVRGLVLSADGQRLATCAIDQTVRLWSAEDGRKQQELSGHQEQVFAVAFHPDGKALVSGDFKGVIKEWDLATGKTVRDLDARVMYMLSRLQDTGGVRYLAFDAGGKVLVCAGTQPKVGANVQGIPTILLFDWETGKVQHTVKVGNDGDGFVYEAHPHPAGFLMAVSSGNPGVGKLFFHRPGDAQPFFQTGMPNCHSLAMHPNGTRLVVSATNGGSNGNGRMIRGKSEYPGNFSPLYIWDFPKPAA
jgi:WD40 repeat protein